MACWLLMWSTPDSRSPVTVWSSDSSAAPPLAELFLLFGDGIAHVGRRVVPAVGDAAQRVDHRPGGPRACGMVDEVVAARGETHAVQVFAGQLGEGTAHIGRTGVA